MNTQRGVSGWAVLLLVAVVTGSLWYAHEAVDSRAYNRGLTVGRLEFEAFKSQTAVLRARAESDRRVQEINDVRKQEKADAERKALLAELAVYRQRVRDDRKRAGPSIVPGPSPSTGGPKQATVDRAELERALREFEEALGRFEAEAEAIAGEGAEAVIDLNTARKWIQK